MEITFHFDASCPWTWITSRWLARAVEVDGDSVRWSPISLDHLNGDDEHRIGVVAGRVVQHLLDRDGNDAAGRFYAAFGRRFHVDGEAEDASTVVAAAVDVGLDEASARAAVDDSALDASLHATTDAAAAAVGPGVGSPILRWRAADGHDVAVSGPVLSEVPDPPHAAALWRAVRTLASTPAFSELKRGHRAEPRTAA